MLNLAPNLYRFFRTGHTYYNWRNVDGQYENVAGFYASVPISRVAELDYVLTSGRYVGLPDEEDDFNFEECFNAREDEFAQHLQEEERFNSLIK